MARKKKHEEHENHERWLVSYADFITLLFAFFVVMYSLSAINEGKFRVLAESLSESFRGPPRSPTPISLGAFGKPSPIESMNLKNSLFPQLPLEQPVKLPKMPPTKEPNSKKKMWGDKDMPGAASQSLSDIANSIGEAMNELIEKGLVKVRLSPYWLEVEINTNILFPSGSAVLEAEATPVLHEIAAIMLNYPNPIQIEGFTDNVPINTPLYPSNWELSTARATSVVQMLAREAIAPERLSAMGHGEFKPVADNSTPEGRTRNRRVVMVILANERYARFREAGLEYREPAVLPDPAPTDSVGADTSSGEPAPST